MALDPWVPLPGPAGLWGVCWAFLCYFKASGLVQSKRKAVNGVYFR